MESVRYVHAADLHLDSPFHGLNFHAPYLSGQQSHPLASKLRQATFTALERLIGLCENEQPDFLILAGDIYNHEEYSVKAQLALRSGCERLSRKGIRVFLAHGNHDPQNSRLNSLSWPENVHIFGTDLQKEIVQKNGQPIALIHGISHGTNRENRNLARIFQREPHFDGFQLGVLHCSLDSDSRKDRYAPCSLEDLRTSNLDAWALGHTHERCILSEYPFIAYCGNSQGLQINESGSRGCFLVTATNNSGQWQCSAQFRQLGPLQWEELVFSIENIEYLDELERKLCSALEDLQAKASPACEGMIVRLRLVGAGVLDAYLRKGSCLEDLQERLEYLSSASPALWIKDIQLACSPQFQLQDYHKREDLVGEAARVSCRLSEQREEMEAFCASALNPLFGHSRMRRALPELESLDLSALLADAEQRCLSILEGQ